MNCPHCGHGQTKVAHVAKYDTVNVRTRKCLSPNCGDVFLTEEACRATGGGRGLKTGKSGK